MVTRLLAPTVAACVAGVACAGLVGIEGNYTIYDGGSSSPASCASGEAGITNCPAGSGSESCCTSLSVQGDTYYRSFDGLVNTDRSNQATVSAFRLDAYEVTVGRMRQYVSYLAAGGSPPAFGSGKHTHLNGGKGLAATGGGYENGWDTSWNSNVATTADGWNSSLLSCGGSDVTWTATAGSNENLPIVCVDWYEAYAFCIWDGGFLPSEAEWNEAAAGGRDQRAYPWSAAYPPGSTAISCTYANYSACSGAPNAVGSEPAGAGKWGQLDLSGNVWEWNLDWYADYVTPCTDCANLTDSALYRTLRGGDFSKDASVLLVSTRDNNLPTYRYVNLGIRCARVP